MLDNQFLGVNKQNDGIIECRTTDNENFLVHHLRIEHIYVKMSIYGIYMSGMA